MSQCDRILADLKRGRVLTHWKALHRYGCARLAARVLELKQRGVNVHSTLVHQGGKKYAAYWIPT